MVRVQDWGRGRATPGRNSSTDNPQDFSYDQSIWQEFIDSLGWHTTATVNVSNGQPTIPFTISDDNVADGNDTIVWTLDNNSTYGFAQDIYIFSEDATQNANGSLQQSIPLVANSTIKAVTIVIQDNDANWPTITGNNNNNSLTGGSNNDNIFAGGGNDSVSGLDGNDNLYGEAGNDTLKGGAGNDYINGGSNNDKLYGELGDDTLDGLSGNDRLYGSDGDDKLWGGDGNDSLDGGNGNDTLSGDAGRDTLAGGAGDDRYYILYDTTDIISESSNQGIDTVISSFSFTLGNNLENLTLIGTTAINGTGNALNNFIVGNEGSNSLSGGDGNDVLQDGGGAANDTLRGGNGDDTLASYGGNDLLYGDAGNDSLSSYNSSGNVTLDGGAGNDSLEGGIGNDSILGGSGDDTLDGEVGNDTLKGGTGNDTYYVRDSRNIIIENPNEGTDTVFTFVDFTLGNQLENLTLSGPATNPYNGAFNGTGNNLNNTITGNTADNTLSGKEGNDTLIGAEGNDTLVGGLGDDSLSGGDGVDYLNGYGTTITNDSQFDTLVGGAGTDYFILGGSWGVSYVETGPGYGIIADWDASLDWIQVKGSSSQYLLKTENKAGTSALDTSIYYTGGGGEELIGVVQDTTNVSLTRDFLFV
jgi:Ca2+-binding RTX toxin-like protein